MKSQFLLIWQKYSNKYWLVVLVVGLIYLFTRLFNLLSLPVFADESIYIRWAQLMRHDSIYLFFSLNDGKPPLFIWLVAGLLSFVANPLFAGRLVSVLAGLIQLWVGDHILQELKANRLARAVQALVIVITPFWFFHHRMALMDSLLVLVLSISWWGLLRLDSSFSKNRSLSWRKVVVNSLVTGFGWGLALLTKTPALFFAPVIVGWAYAGRFADWTEYKNQATWRLFVRRTLGFGLAGLSGLALFGLLKIHPAFGSLFTRSNDFTFTISELLSGEWRVTIDNLGRALSWLSTYLRPEFMSLPFIALLVSRRRTLHWRILAGAGLLALPFIVFGRTVHPRYYLPTAPFLTASGALLVSEIWRQVKKYQNTNIQLVFWLLVLSFLIGSLRFMFLSWFTPDQTPFVLADRSQYLTEWSSGHGINEVRDLMIEEVRDGDRLTVVTEGSFGTLPDALLMYFDNRPEIKYLRIEGLAQYPVKSIPDWVWEEADDHQTWLVVNANRMEVQDERLKLKAQYPRPYGAPELQVYELQAK